MRLYSSEFVLCGGVNQVESRLNDRVRIFSSYRTQVPQKEVPIFEDPLKLICVAVTIHHHCKHSTNLTTGDGFRMRAVNLRFRLLLLVALVVAHQVPSVSAAWARPPTPPKNTKKDESSSETKVEAVVAAAAAMIPPSLPQKLPYLLGAAILASTDTFVHKLFNETDRLELKHEKGKYKRTLVYAGAYSITVSVMHVLSGYTVVVNKNHLIL